MKNLFTAILLLITHVSIAQKFKLPDAKLSADVVCGNCKPGNLGDVFYFTKKPYSPDIDNNSTIESIAYALLGHTVPADDYSGDIANTCSTTSSNPFSMDDIKKSGSDGRTISYSRTERLKLNIDAAVKGNLDELRKYTVDSSKLLKLEATIKASYAKINDKDLTVTGKYSEWVLKKDAIEKIIKGDGFQECKKFLNEKKYKLITAVGIVNFDIDFQQNSLDSLASDIQAEVSRLGIQADIRFTFKKEVSQNLKATTKDMFQIIAWRTAPASYLDLN
jgi:hypothetical protein